MADEYLVTSFFDDLIDIVPCFGGSSSRKRGKTEWCEFENTTKTAIKHYGGGVSLKSSFFVEPLEIVPCYGGSSSKKRGKTEWCEFENTTKTAIKHRGGGVSSKCSKKQKAGEFFDKCSGKSGSKKEVCYESSVKFDDEFDGSTTEYQTQVKFKKITTKAPRKSSYKRIKCKKYH